MYSTVACAKRSCIRRILSLREQDLPLDQVRVPIVRIDGEDFRDQIVGAAQVSLGASLIATRILSARVRQAEP